MELLLFCKKEENTSIIKYRDGGQTDASQTKKKTHAQVAATQPLLNKDNSPTTNSPVASGKPLLWTTTARVAQRCIGQESGVS